MLNHSRIDTIAAFRSECLNNERDIFVYLPPGYEQQQARAYPVLYVHDGQNIFSDAYNGQSWELHNVCDRLIAEGRIEELIIVAIANMGPERNSEFAHNGSFAAMLNYPCRGELYERFLVEELKPYIDQTYRTKPESRHTALMGSSRGGLVTYHIGFRRPDIFGKLAMISPYFAQYDEEEMKHDPMIQTFDHKCPLQLWIDTGGMEGMTVQVPHVRGMVEHFIKLGYRSGEDLMFCYEPDAEHNEEAWRRRVHAPLIYFFGDKGLPSAVALIGDDLAGLNNPGSCVYPILVYENGLKVVDMEAQLTVSPSGTAAVSPSGSIIAVRTGRCKIEYIHSGYSAAKALQIVEDVSSEAVIDLEVAVPADTSGNARVYAGVELEKIAPYTYRRRFTLPRGTGFSFHICEYSGLREADHAGKDVPKRRFVANEDLTLRYEVLGWQQEQSI
jgi:predicted alpha/beta superfamily hydrolase